HQGLHHNHADAVALGLVHQARQLGLNRDEVEVPREALVEARVLAEVVRAQDYVAVAAVDRVVEAFGQIPRVARHPGEPNLALAARLRDEFVPLGILQPRRIVDRMVEVHVDVIGLQAAQTCFERGHHRTATVVRARDRLRGQEYLVALALERVAYRSFGFAVGVRLGRIKVVDPAIKRVTDQVFFSGGQAAGAERDVRNLETGAAKRRVTANVRRRLDRCAGDAGQRQDRYAHAGKHASFQE